ncbi:MAG: FG-GAP-like repeat-containing protein [Bacteroidetes bacterium]|jgi:hypothetical protein|nr:FG-GAP-like repeat-containing protein [Bacteroidota bacterium]
MKKVIFTVNCLFVSILLSSQIFYSNVASQVGVNHTYNGGIGGGGVSFCDFDNDGWDDITLATEEGREIYFYKNENGSFQKLAPLVSLQGEAKQVLWVDFDNDGDKDFYVAIYNGTNRLYENKGGLTFLDITESAGLPNDEEKSFGACWGDFDRDGWLDLYYGERKPPFTENRLFHNNADGTFTEVTTSSGAEDPGKTPFCSSFFDFNNDKWPDLYTANDKNTLNTLLVNNHDGTFTDIGESANANLEMNAMCVAIGDYNNNGWQDVYVTNTPEGNALLQNNGDGTFTETAASAGVGFYGIGWGSNFLDADNDLDLDLYVSGLPLGVGSKFSQFYENDGTGIFQELNTSFAGDTVKSFNNAIGDFNHDGYPDIIVLNEAPGNAKLWENGGGNNNWLKIELEGVLSNRDAIGSKIEVFAGGAYQMRYIHCGIGFLGQNSGTEIIGLKDHVMADSIVVTWPTGHIDRLYEVAKSQTIHLIEGTTTNGEIFVDSDVELVIVNTNEAIHPDVEINIFPNPSVSVLNLHLSKLGFSKAIILNAKGESIFSKRIETMETQLDVSHLPKGIYFLAVVDEKGRRVVKKWIRS